MSAALAAANTRWAEYRAAARRHFEQGEHQQAERAFVAAIREALTFGEHDLRVATTLSEWGLIAYARADWPKAERMLSQALTIVERRLGSQHVAVARALVNLGALHYRQNELDKAQALFERALGIHEKLPAGASHPDLVPLLKHIARLHFKRGDHLAAAPVLERLVLMSEKENGESHPELAIYLVALSRARAAAGMHAEAESIARRALSIRIATLPPTDGQIAAALELVAWHCEQRAVREAELAQSMKTLGSANTAGIERAAFESESARAEAETLRERARTLRAEAKSPVEPSTLETIAPASEAAPRPEPEPAKPTRVALPTPAWLNTVPEQEARAAEVTPAAQALAPHTAAVRSAAADAIVVADTPALLPDPQATVTAEATEPPPRASYWELPRPISAARAAAELLPHLNPLREGIAISRAMVVPLPKILVTNPVPAIRRSRPAQWLSAWVRRGWGVRREWVMAVTLIGIAAGVIVAGIPTHPSADIERLVLVRHRVMTPRPLPITTTVAGTPPSISASRATSNDSTSTAHHKSPPIPSIDVNFDRIADRVEQQNAKLLSKRVDSISKNVDVKPVQFPKVYVRRPIP